MKKIISFLLILSVLSVCIFLVSSCGGANKSSGSNNDGNGDSSNTENPDDVSAPANVKLRPDIPEADYNWYNFRVLISVNGEIAILNDFYAEEETGDVINDAIYNRNAFVEEKYNIKIVDMPMPEGDGMDRPAAQKNIKKAVAAGDNSYDSAMLSGYATAALTQSGTLMDLNGMEHIDLSKPWWDQMANRDLMIKNRMFYTTGALSNVVNRATYAILFNKKMIKDFGLEDPYALVKNNEWTYDKLIEMAAAVTQDLNGDGIIEFEDKLGALVWDDTMMGIINSIGERCAVINSKDEIELTLFNEKTLKVFDKYMDFVLSDNALTYQRKDWASVKSDAMFQNDQALFYLQIMELVVRLRAMEIDFGVLPYPKLEKTQENYYSTVGSWHSGFICVPMGQEDPSRTGAILEALAAESMYTLLPAYYDIALKGKYVRDEESEEMLDLIFGSKVFDLGWIYQIGGYNEEIMNQLRNNKKDFASMYDKRESKAFKDIDKINNAFNEILN